MAVEQDWAAYADQAHLKTTDTLLARTAGGGGVEVAGSHILARRANTTPYFANAITQGVSAVSLSIEGFAGGYGAGISFRSNLAGSGADAEMARITADGENSWSSVIGIGSQDAGLRFFTALDGVVAEKLRLTAPGYIGIGTVAPSYALDCQAGNVAATDSFVLRRGSDKAVMSNINWIASGDWLEFNNANGGGFRWSVNSALRWTIQSVGHLVPAFDNAVNIGNGSARIGTLYAVSGTINTSDERDKVWRGDLTDAEYEAGKQVINELGFFQWKDSVEEKGKGARLHFGSRAQRVWAIFADHGLVGRITKGKPGKTPYSFLCYDQWDEELSPVYETRKREVLAPFNPDKPRAKGKVLEAVEEQHDTGKTQVTRKAGDRYGLRITDLCLFLLAVNARRQNEVEARLAALEGK